MKREREKKRQNSMQRARRKHIPMWPFYLLLGVLIIFYALNNSFITGISIFLLILLIIILEAKISVATEGAKRSAIDIILALAGVSVFWISLILILQTPSPIDTVASCSMLPALQRGDIVVLHGIGNPAQFAKSHNIPIINISAQEFNNMENNMNSEFLAYYAYFDSNKSKISAIVPVGSSYKIGLYNTYCISNYLYLGRGKEIYKCFVSSQDDNLIKYSYSIGNVALNGKIYNIIYTSSITIGNVTLTQNFSNPIIVYRTTSRDYFSGDIIHRAYALINASGSYYFITMGDNNPGLDIEFANYPPNSSSVLGYVIAKVPILGYLKLILSGQFGKVAGCNQTIIR
ncbi:MAG: hypothetical protein ACP5K3_01490 [Candidatus Micrarchaeia archaeon]